MNRIDQLFTDLRAAGGKALMPFVTTGDPDLDTTGKLLPAIQDAGAHICELGIPFSDPIADGPVIQASMTYALERGVRPGQIFELVQRLRAKLTLGLVAMLSYTIVHRIGVRRFVADAARAGIDGLIVPDLTVEESDELRGVAAEAGLVCSFLISPTTPIQRADRIARACTGFVYVVSRAGITGERAQLPPELPGRIRQLRGVTDLPIAVGFGISSAEQVRQVVSVADAAIVGSAIVRRVAEHRDSGGDEVVRQIRAQVAELAAGLDRVAVHASGG